MKRFALALFSFLAALTVHSALTPQKVIMVGYALDEGCDPALFDEQMHDQVVAVETLFAAHGRFVSVFLVPVKIAPAPLVAGEMAVNDETMAWARAQAAAHPEVDYIVLGSERNIRFNRTAAGVKVNGIATAYSLYGTKVCLMNVRMTARNVFAHEFTHFLGYKGVADDTVHATDEANLMAAQSFNQWGVDPQILALWDDFRTVTEARRR